MKVVGSVAYLVDHYAVPASGHLIDEDQVAGIAADVQSILRDDTGVQAAREALTDLVKTDFDSAILESILAAPESFDEWRVGEALAEYYLSRVKGCNFPWPDSRSTRNPNSSGGGVDLIGLQSGERFRFVLAEAKTSHQQAWPPTVLTSRSHGLHSQLTGLNAGDSRSEWAIKYLIMNGNGRPWFEDVRAASETYIANKFDVVIYGVLIHLTNPDQSDLQAQADRLSESLSEPTTMELVAIYLTADSLNKIAAANVVVETAA